MNWCLHRASIARARDESLVAERVKGWSGDLLFLFHGSTTPNFLDRSAHFHLPTRDDATSAATTTAPAEDTRLPGEENTKPAPPHFKHPLGLRTPPSRGFGHLAKPSQLPLGKPGQGVKPGQFLSFESF